MASADAFRRHGLYYPFFHVRDDRWLKVSALYWPRIARLVPERYPTGDSVTARAFSSTDPEFFYRLSPGDSVEEVGARFAQILELCGRELAQRFGRYDWQATAAGVHVTHISKALAAQLVEMRLALYPIDPWGDFKGYWRSRPSWYRSRGEGLPYYGERLPYEGWGGEDLPYYGERLPYEGWGGEDLPYRESLGGDISGWVAMPEELVVVYNSMLVEDVAAANQLQPTTDQPDAYIVVNDWSADRIAAELLHRPGPQSPVAASELAQTLAFLAINAVVPANLDDVPAEKILEIRERYGPEFRAFGLAVDQAASDLAQLADIRDPAIIERYLQDEVASRFIQPTENLRRQLRGLKLDAATMTINVKTDLPAAAGLIGGATLAGHP